MKLDKIEQEIVRSIVRKGEQEAIEELKIIDSSDELRKLMSYAEIKYRVTPGGRRIWISMATTAAVVLLVLIVGFQPRYSTKDLYEQWSKKVVYEPDVVRGGDPAQVTFESALALVQQGKSKQAIEQLSLVSADTDSPYAQDARWYLATTYLYIGERSYAKATLKIIIENHEAYAEQASKLLHQITQRLWF